MHRVLATVVLVWGVVAASRAALGALGADYWRPVTTLDYLSIWTYSAALGLTALIAWVTGWLARARRHAAVAGAIAGAGFAFAGMANGLEDGLGISSFGMAYVIAILTGGIGQIALAVILRSAGERLLAGLAGLLLVPFFLLASWLGVLVVAPAAWAAWRLWAQRASAAVVGDAPVPA
jgi:hypothetical protein